MARRKKIDKERDFLAELSAQIRPWIHRHFGRFSCRYQSLKGFKVLRQRIMRIASKNLGWNWRRKKSGNERRSETKWRRVSGRANWRRQNGTATAENSKNYTFSMPYLTHLWMINCLIYQLFIFVLNFANFFKGLFATLLL